MPETSVRKECSGNVYRGCFHRTYIALRRMTWDLQSPTHRMFVIVMVDLKAMESV